MSDVTSMDGNRVFQFVRSHPGIELHELQDKFKDCSREEFLIPFARGWIVTRYVQKDGAMIPRLCSYEIKIGGNPFAQCMDVLLDLFDNPDKICIIDTETTGLSSYRDEILQLSIIDGTGAERINRFFKPEHAISWPEAERINHISPAKVSNAPNIRQHANEISEILRDYDAIVGYNVNFDLDFLVAAGVDVPDVTIVDVMEDFAPIAGEWADWADSWKWQKLTTCAAYYGYKPTEGAHAHDSLEDCRMTLHCCKCIALDQFNRGRFWHA